MFAARDSSQLRALIAAAQWNTVLHPEAARRNDASSSMSPVTTSMSGNVALSADTERDIARTDQPFDSRASTMYDPTIPVAPVTSATDTLFVGERKRDDFGLRFTGWQLTRGIPSRRESRAVFNLASHHSESDRA